MSLSKQPVFRFAPSPNGRLHLGHALSAILNHDMARTTGGRFLLRIEDIDAARCTPEHEAEIFADLEWLGLSWETPCRRQSEHFDVYKQALANLVEQGLAYPSFRTRGEAKAIVAAHEHDGMQWPRDPDGAPLYPGNERNLTDAQRQRILAEGRPHAWRLDMRKAVAMMVGPLSWKEIGVGQNGETDVIAADPAAWGDIVLSRSDAPSSYHLSVTVDDALQGITHVVRGRDLYHATAVHRLLQRLLDLPEPIYHHHRLVLAPDGRKLSKSNRDTGLSVLRAAGKTPTDIRAMIL